jgi:hypothetical protein
MRDARGRPLARRNERERGGGDRRARENEQSAEPPEPEGRPGVLDEEPPRLQEIERRRARLHRLKRADEQEEREDDPGRPPEGSGEAPRRGPVRRCRTAKLESVDAFHERSRSCRGAPSALA